MLIYTENGMGEFDYNQNMTAPIRVILADDHAMFRQGTAELLNHEADIEVVGQAADGQEAIELTARLHPDIVVMDVRMPGLSGIEATRRIRSQHPDVQVLVLTAHDDDQYIFSLLQAGASGYLLKSAPISDLINAIRHVQAGESPLDPGIARKVVLQLTGEGEKRSSASSEEQPYDGLSPRELEVLQLLARGMNNRAIAETLFISERTVQAHLTSIFAKMQVNSRLEAVLAAIRRGWLTLEF